MWVENIRRSIALEYNELMREIEKFDLYHAEVRVLAGRLARLMDLTMKLCEKIEEIDDHIISDSSNIDNVLQRLDDLENNVVYISDCSRCMDKIEEKVKQMISHETSYYDQKISELYYELKNKC